MKNQKTKVSDIVTIVLFLALLFGFSVSFFVLPDKTASPVEVGSLQQMPSFTKGYHDNNTGYDYVGADYLLHGKLADDFDEYFCDQFPLRTMFLGLKSLNEVVFGRNVSGNVLYKDGDLATLRFNAVGFDTATEYYSKTHVVESIQNLNALCEKQSIPTAVILPPRSIDVKAEAMGYPTDGSDDLHALIAENISDKYYINLLDTLRNRYTDGEQVYFKTDHHWTVEGAYYAYAALMESWGITPYAMEDFSFETVTENFKGTALRNGNFFFMDGEELQLARYEGDEDFEVSSLKLSLAADKAFDGLYDLSAANGKDPYTTFLHGKPVHMKISKPDEDRETLLVMKDSFGHSLVPFLARHFDIVIVDIDESNMYGTMLSSAVAMTKPDRVLLVYNVENLITNEKLKKMK